MGYGGGGGGSGGGGGGGSEGFSSAAAPTTGAFRFNTDSSQLEIYDGNQWTGILATSPEQQTGGTRAVFGGGYSNSPHPTMDTLDYVNVATTGNAIDFGNLTVGRSAKSGGSSRTRGLFTGGRFSPTSDGYNTIDYITISSTGNALDFGDLTGETRNPAKEGLSDQTRAVFAGGYSMPGQSYVDSMEYVTIASTGDGVDFGNMSASGWVWHSGGSNGTRGIYASGRGPGAPTWVNNIEYITISTTGNTADFGDTIVKKSNSSGSMTNAVRMVMGPGLDAPSSYNNTIDYITMATLGNSKDFGDASAGEQGQSQASSPTRGVMYIGATTTGNTIEYIQIMTTGNAVDFGDLSAARRTYGAVSNGHGGL